MQLVIKLLLLLFVGVVTTGQHFRQLKSTPGNAQKRSSHIRMKGTLVPVQESIIVTEADNGSSIQLYQFDALFVVLEGNPTTGFTWHRIPPDNSTNTNIPVLTPIYYPDGSEYEYQPFITLPGYTGSSGNFTFRFLASSLGSEKLNFEYRRAWEPSTFPAARNFSLTTQVILHPF